METSSIYALVFSLFGLFLCGLGIYYYRNWIQQQLIHKKLMFELERAVNNYDTITQRCKFHNEILRKLDIIIRGAISYVDDNGRYIVTNELRQIAYNIEWNSLRNLFPRYVSYLSTDDFPYEDRKNPLKLEDFKKATERIRKELEEREKEFIPFEKKYKSLFHVNFFKTYTLCSDTEVDNVMYQFESAISTYFIWMFKFYTKYSTILDIFVPHFLATAGKFKHKNFYIQGPLFYPEQFRQTTK